MSRGYDSRDTPPRTIPRDSRPQVGLIPHVADTAAASEEALSRTSGLGACCLSSDSGVVGSRSPVSLPGNNPPQVSLGDSHGLIVAGDGSLQVDWGAEESGWPVLGQRTESAPPLFAPRPAKSDPTPIGSSPPPAVIWPSHFAPDGSIWGWGANYRHQLCPIPARIVDGPARRGRHQLGGGGRRILHQPCPSARWDPLGVGTQ